MRKTRAETMAETRRRLLDAAARAFARAGYGETSVRDIANAAGLTTGALYAHFPGKEDLFLVLLEERYQTKIDELTRLVAESSTVSDSLDAFSGRFSRLRDIEGDADLLATEFWLYAARRPPVRRKLARLYRRLHEGIADLIASHPDLPAGTDASRLATLLIALGDGLGIQARIDPSSARRGLLGDVIREFLAACVEAR